MSQDYHLETKRFIYYLLLMYQLLFIIIPTHSLKSYQTLQFKKLLNSKKNWNKEVTFVP